MKLRYSLFITGFTTLSLLFTGCKKENNVTDEPKDPITTFFANEIRPPMGYSCFPGAYYRKAVTSKDQWVGMTATVILPTISFDPNRVNPAKPQQYLDNPSVYMGGNANNQETDIGLTWEVIRDENGTISPDRRAFRPFMRRTGYAGTGQTSNYANAPAEAQYYWYPGEEVTITLLVTSNGILHFTVEGNGKKYESDYACDGYTFGSYIEFKRVNAIDQVSNEGKPVQATKTKVEGARWLRTSLYRRIEGTNVIVPMHSGRFTDMRCPDLKYFVIQSSEAEKKIGAESITIDGGR